MLTKEVLTEQEQAVLRNVPFSVGIAIIFCDYGAIGSVFETISLASQLRDAEKKLS